MRILVHDYSGHPFQAQLSRELARRGHSVEHVHCASYVSGKGALKPRNDDSSRLTFTALGVGRSFDKYKARRRIAQEFAYSREFIAHVSASSPDMVVMCNVPLIAHARIDRWLKSRQIPTVFWHQDVYSHAIGLEARRRLGPVGRLIARLADRAERNIAVRAESIVAISEHFLPVHARWGVDQDKIRVIPNWAPLDEVVPRPRDNAWAKEHDLDRRPVLLYSGTLGLKHDPSQLVALIRNIRVTLPEAVLVVVSDGPAADWLRAVGEPGIKVLPFQPFDRLSDVLGSADLLLTVLEPSASDYSVPSKTLTYLCAGRPVVGLLPRGNPAYAVIQDSGGLPIDSAGDLTEAAGWISRILSDPEELSLRAKLARGYAETKFDIVELADRFELALGLPGARDNLIPLQARPHRTATVSLDPPEVLQA